MQHTRAGCIRPRHQRHDGSSRPQRRADRRHVRVTGAPNVLTDNRLGDFLRARRAQIAPGDVGLSDGPRRKVPGLRREEVAHLAGVSADYYARLEQGRQPTASAYVLDAVASALQLGDAERRYLHDLAHARRSRRKSADDPRSASEFRVSHLMRAFGLTPAILCNRTLDVVAANPAARFLFDDFAAMPPRERNSVRWILLSPRARLLYGSQWSSACAEMIGLLRLTSVGEDGPRLRNIVSELRASSELFRTLWPAHQVSRSLHETKVLNVPGLGSAKFVNEFMIVQSMKDLMLALVIPNDRIAFETAFARLWSPPRAEASRSATTSTASESEQPVIP